MDLLLDADALIKLQRAGILGQVAKEFSCVIPEIVYQEAVSEGKVRGYADALEIERVVEGAIAVHPEGQPLEGAGPVAGLRLGRGESAVLRSYERGNADAVVSDDRKFLAELSRRNARFMTPSALPVALARLGAIDFDAAVGAMKRLRPWIRIDAYREAMRVLEEMKESHS